MLHPESVVRKEPVLVPFSIQAAGLQAPFSFFSGSASGSDERSESTIGGQLPFAEVRERLKLVRGRKGKPSLASIAVGVELEWASWGSLDILLNELLFESITAARRRISDVSWRADGSAHVVFLSKVSA